MSDLCMYEFEDTVWDEFCQTYDHTVPRPGFERMNNNSILAVNHNKPHREVNGTEDRLTARNVDLGSKQSEFSTPIKRKLGKYSLCHTQSGLFPSSDSNGSEFHADDTIVSGNTNSVDTNSFNYPLGDITKTCNNLNLFENTGDKDSNDILYYNWPEIGNFEDVMMFRSNDSAFGLGDSKEDEMNWFSSADYIGESGDLIKSEAMEKIPQNHDTSKRYSATDSAPESGVILCEGGSWNSPISDPYVSFVNGTAMVDSKDGFFFKEQDNEQKQFKLQNHFVGGKSEFKPSICDSSTELGSLNTQWNSTMSSGQDDNSLEATCFRQLQLVIEQLDTRTKLCMKESLYRLARSAEQRNNYADLNGGYGDEIDSNGALMAEGTNKCSSFMDMETNTNPIDRSIAHLLFHRPSESSTQDSLQTEVT